MILAAVGHHANPQIFRNALNPQGEACSNARRGADRDQAKLHALLNAVHDIRFRLVSGVRQGLSK